MTNRRFQSMYALWTVNAHNLLLTGSFDRLNPFVMATWTNDIAVGINQDPLGVPAQRIDNASALGPGTILHVDEVEAAHYTSRVSWVDQAGQEQVGLGRNVALMTVAECGGEPAAQTWELDSASGIFSNKATGTCLNVIGDAWHNCRVLVFDKCTSRSMSAWGWNTSAAAAPPPPPPPQCTPHSVHWRLNASSEQLTCPQYPSAEGFCATEQRDGTVTLSKCLSPVPDTQQWKYDRSTKQLTQGDRIHCVTASTPKSKIKQATLIIGRPLAGAPRSFAMVFLNNLDHSTSVTCDTQCMGRMLAMRPPKGSPHYDRAQSIGHAAANAATSYDICQDLLPSTPQDSL
eukprot:COSAG05_NODE_2079_length_3603_cov_2.777968_2_plen_345_part_00